LRYQLISETGYPNYANVLAVRVGGKAGLADCLHKLVPILQRAQIDFVKHPAAAITAMLAANDEYRTGFHLDRPLAEYGARTMLARGIVGNGSSPALGDFDTDRIARLIGILVPTLKDQGKRVKDGLNPLDVVTNTYVDTKISLPAGG
jgi:hypothetical protein